MALSKENHVLDLAYTGRQLQDRPIFPVELLSSTDWVATVDRNWTLKLESTSGIFSYLFGELYNYMNAYITFMMISH